MSAQEFNSVLLDISSRLSGDDMEKLKFLVRGEIGRRDLEKISAGHRLFEVLTERRKLSPDNTQYLCDLLKAVNRPDLAERLLRFGSPGGSSDPVLDETETAKLAVATEVIAENLGKNWRKLGRRLKISDVKLESVSRKHPTDLEETVRELLREWRKSRGAEAQTEELIRALRECHFNLTADTVEDKLRTCGHQ